MVSALDSEIKIVSGEGTGNGHIELYTGKRTARAVLARLTRERCGGDRWAYATVDGERFDGEEIDQVLPTE